MLKRMSAFRWNAIGPAILLTATSVGAGDILTGSLAGAEAGTAVLWAVVAGVVLKWTLTEGIARWQMATGTTLLEGWVTRLGRWIRWVFLAYLLIFAIVTGGMLSSACGLAATAMLPLGAGQTSRMWWASIHSLAGVALVWFGGYATLKRVLAVCVGAMFSTILLTAFLLAPDWNAVAAGLVPTLPSGSSRWVVSLMGAVGGTMALVSYGYWIREEGRIGKDGLRQCRFDLLLSYGVIGLFGLAVVIIGSRVKVTGQGTEFALLLAEQLARSLGSAGQWIFLIGFWAAVFSALLGVWQSLPYLYADFHRLRMPQAVTADGLETSRQYKGFLLVLGTAPLILVQWPVKALQLAFGLTGAMLLPMLALTLLILNNRKEWVGADFHSSPWMNAVLAAGLLFFGYVGAREIRQLLGM